MTVVKFYPANAANNPDAVLEQAVGVYDHVLVIGWDKAGMMDARASADLDAQQAVWLIDQFKHNIFAGAFEE